MLAPFRGRPLVSWPVSAACGSVAEQVILVTGRDAETVADSVAEHSKLRVVENVHYDRGISESLRAGLTKVCAPDGIAVVLGDMPLVDTLLLNQLFRAWVPGAYAVVPHCEGRLGNPIVLGPNAVSDCARLEGDIGARHLVRTSRADIIRVPFCGKAIFRDIDDSRDLEP